MTDKCQEQMLHSVCHARPVQETGISMYAYHIMKAEFLFCSCLGAVMHFLHIALIFIS